MAASGGAICLAESGSCVKSRAGATSSRSAGRTRLAFINSLRTRQAWLGLRELKRDGAHIPLRGCLIEVKMKHEQLSSSPHPTFTDLFTDYIAQMLRTIDPAGHRRFSSGLHSWLLMTTKHRGCCRPLFPETFAKPNEYQRRVRKRVHQPHSFIS